MKIRKKAIALILAAAMALTLAACSGGGNSSGGSSGSDDTVYRLSLTFHDSTQAIKTQFVQAWADEVYEATDGRVEITVYAGGTLASSTDALDAVKQRTADIAVCFTSFFPGQFPLTEVVSLPMTGLTNAVQATNVLWDLWESNTALQDELSDYKVLMLYTNPNNIICTNTPVYTADDMAGLKLRVTSGTPSDMSQAWGATPMTISSSEIYQSMEKDVIQGYLIDYTGVNAWSLYEVTDYYTEMPFYVAPWVILMNMDSWNELPEDLQEIINGLSDRQRSLDFAEVNEQEADETREMAVSEYGATIIEPTDEQLATFQPAADEYIQDWIDTYGSDTFDAEEYVNTVLELAEQYAD
ncbi:MAG: TRAP transporter substrate-binding protein [Oscillospiraceae bacterium]|nr:TRAP transporter substrate-binding protein [Oscillospiraceae bacterium]